MNTITRADVIADVRRDLRGISHLRRNGAPRSEILAALRNVASLRRYAASIGRIDPTGRAFYVTIQRDDRSGLLYGPFDTQEEAVKNVDLVRNVAHRVASADAAFSSFGTGSVPRERARPGVLNAYLPPIGGRTEAA